MNLFIKDIPRFDGPNYDSWKKKRKNHILCMGPIYWILTKSKNKTFEEEKLEGCSEDESDLSMCNMRAEEALLSSLP